MKKNSNTELKKMISKYDFISFDIFDTLISRNIEKPTDVFIFIEKEYEEMYKEKIEGWFNIRINAEKEAREKSDKEEITLRDVYNCIQYSNVVKERLYKIELEMEIDLSSTIEKNIKILDYCLKEGKKVILTSDMYLPKDTIEKILKKNKIAYDKLYLSSEVKLTKETGNLFKYIISDLKISNTKIIHFGDNYQSDYIIPMMLGIKAIHLKREKIKKQKDIRKEDKFSYTCLNYFINNKLDEKNNYFYNTGYATLGPLLYGYSKWLECEFDKEQFDNIFFLARDGYIMQKAFKIISDRKTEYMYASRRALIIPTIWKYEDFSLLKENMKFPRKITIKSLLKKFGLESEKYKETIEKYGYNLEEEILTEDINEENLRFYLQIKNDIYKNSKEEYENLIKYLKKHKFEGKTAIVDIGWHGNMQYAINNITPMAELNTELYGYYVGIVPNSEKQKILNMKAFLFDQNEEEFYYKELFFNSLFELIFSTQHGSVKKYVSNSKEVEFYSYEYENSLDKEKIINFQAGAIDFVRDFNASKLSKFIDFNKYISTYKLFELGNQPSTLDIKMFGNIDFYDDDIHKLVEVKSLFYYIGHPKKFVDEFHNAHWKPAFLRRLFKININYYNLIYKLKFRKDKNKNN